MTKNIKFVEKKLSQILLLSMKAKFFALFKLRTCILEDQSFKNFIATHEIKIPTSIRARNLYFGRSKLQPLRKRDRQEELAI